MKVTMDDFVKYEALRLSGKANMLDTWSVRVITGLSDEQIFEIHTNYEKYKEKHDEGIYLP